MKFKNDNQRKAVMAKLKNKNFFQLQKKGIFLKYQGDYDKDGIVNIHDCRPLNPDKQGFLHELKMKRLKAQEEKLQKKRERLEHKLENKKEEYELKNRIKISKLKAKQMLIDEAEKEKRTVEELKRKNKEIEKRLEEGTLKQKLKIGAKKLRDSPQTKKALKLLKKEIFG